MGGDCLPEKAFALIRRRDEVARRLAMLDLKCRIVSMAAQGLKHREIAASVGKSRATITETLGRLRMRRYATCGGRVGRIVGGLDLDTL